MPTILGSVINAALVHGLQVLEALAPMPARLGVPLAPGADDRRDPVVLVGGFANTPSSWNEWRRSLEADGFRVFVVDISSNGLGDAMRSAREVAAAVDRVRRLTGSTRVDLVGFSEGGILARMYVALLGGATSVDHLVTLASPNQGVALEGVARIVRGIPILGAALPEVAEQLLRGSAMLRRLEDAELDARTHGGNGVRYGSVYAATTDGAISARAAWLAGAENRPVDGRLLGLPFGPSHFHMLHLSDAAYEAARGMLLLERPVPAVAGATSRSSVIAAALAAHALGSRRAASAH